MELHKSGAIEDHTLRALCSECGSTLPPRIYFTVKTHKPNHPVRPVVSTPGTATYALASMVQSICKTVPANTELNILNSTELLQRLSGITMDDNDVVVSFDVVSLYTNVPQSEALAAAMSRFSAMETTWPKALFEEALTLIVGRSNYFKYEDQFYRQTKGLAIGLSVAGTLATYVLDDYVEKTLRATNITPKLLVKYVDDFLVITNRENVNKLFHALNNGHDSLKFTLEEAVDQKIPFLDVTVEQDNDKLITKWYTKAMASGRILNYNSAHPPAMKFNVALQLSTRAIHLSNQRYHQEVYNKIWNIWEKNKYPRATIKKVIHRTKNPEIREPRSEAADDDTRPMPVKIPYIPIISDKINKNLRLADKDKRLLIGNAPVDKLRNAFTKTKAKVDQPTIGAVYKLECTTEACSRTYVGETGRNVKTRWKEHESDYKNATRELQRVENHMREALKLHGTQARTRRQKEAEEEVKIQMNLVRKSRTYKTAALNHQMWEDHKFDMENPKVITREKKYFRRKALESWYVHLEGGNAVNYKVDTKYLNPQAILVMNEFKAQKIRDMSRTEHLGTPTNI